MKKEICRRLVKNMSQDTISLTLEPRSVTGKSVKHLRKNGHIPAVIHDHGKDSLVVQAEAVAMLKVWRQAGKHHPIDLKTGDQSYIALIKDAVFDPRKHQLTHVVFNAVDKNQKVEADIPVRPRYAEENEASPAERSSLIVLTQLETVQVKAVASKLPDFLEYDAEKLIDVGDHITVADLVIPEGVELETEIEHAVATVYELSALAAANDAAGGTAEEEEPTEEEGEGEETDGEAGEESGAETSTSDDDKTESNDEKPSAAE
jgi:large subunit ribosomal protein L25